MRIRTFLLVAVNDPWVALTHGIGGMAGLAHPVVVTSRSATVTLVWKNVVVTFEPFFFWSRNLYAPVPLVLVV